MENTKCPVCGTSISIQLGSTTKCSGCRSVLKLSKTPLKGYREYQFKRGQNVLIVQDSEHNPTTYVEKSS